MKSRFGWNMAASDVVAHDAHWLRSNSETMRASANANGHHSLRYLYLLLRSKLIHFFRIHRTEYFFPIVSVAVRLFACHTRLWISPQIESPEGEGDDRIEDGR